MTLKSLQTQLPNKLEGSGDAGTFSDSVASRAAGVLSYGQTLSPPLLCFPILSTTRPSGSRTVKLGQLHPTSGATLSGHMAWSLAAPSDSPTLLAAGVQAGPPGSGAAHPGRMCPVCYGRRVLAPAR